MRTNKIPISTTVSQEDYQKLFAIKDQKEKKAGVTISFSQVASEAIRQGIIIIEQEHQGSSSSSEV
jgi:hypothetical protein